MTTVVLLRTGPQDDVWQARLTAALTGAEGIDAVLTRPFGTPCVPVGAGPVVHVLHAVAGALGHDLLHRWLTQQAGAGVVVVAASQTGTLAQVVELFRAGVRGFVLTGAPREEVVTAVRAVAAGHPFVPPVLLAGVTRLATRPTVPGPVVPLTERELEVLRHMALGRSNAQVAERLFIAPATVRTHVLSILRKLGARNRTDAVVRAYRTGLLDMETDETEIDGRDAVGRL
ncbi:helix-turn-helix transcriptional regulator [Cellulomonas shaoxiangyii]|uniref:Response regulator transcription factor n=1 Tax=Cellulomonas shaoxiangyii TaxID=2566013 RepID=A0A4P7SL79_9CELL|nr:response regulator transcription factor [Cellulomonas shaoxiangyii]QCB94980.1 response regulator transcription factor [Cellulomonas shaoxiangyii]TGY77250.1 response regulator transcription factor [Cellulomonas shaoxiangyii]